MFLVWGHLVEVKMSLNINQFERQCHAGFLISKDEGVRKLTRFIFINLNLQV